MPKLSPLQIRAFEGIVGQKNVLNRPEELIAYECEAALLFKAVPDLVIIPQSAKEVLDVVQLCRKYRIPYIARGAGTGLSGGSIPTQGGVLISLAALSQILEIDPINRTATVEAGVLNGQLNEALKSHDLFYAPDPSSQSACTIGGNIAENAGGIHCLKYGVTVDHVQAVEIVTPEGELIWIGDKHGQTPGPQWLSLIIGSEGTFGIVTKAILKLTPQPQRTKVFLAAFNALLQATGCVSKIIESDIEPAALEFMDAFTTQSVNQAFDIGLPHDATAILIIELDGTPMMVEHGQKKLHQYLKQFKACEIQEAEDEYERKRLWMCRKLAVASYGQYYPSFYLHDCVIPRGQLTTVLEKIIAIGKQHDVLIGNVFHAGDGNLHPNILFDPKDQAMLQRALSAGEEILQVCLDAGGVLSGEHGVGLEKQAYMTRQFNPETLQMMADLKSVFDPDNLCNPGKIIPHRQTCGEARAKAATHLEDNPRIEVTR